MAKHVEKQYLFIKGVFNMIDQLFNKQFPDIVKEIDKVINVAQDIRIKAYFTGTTTNMPLPASGSLVSPPELIEELRGIINTFESNLPNLEVLDKLMRYQTSLNNQLSKQMGELIELEKRYDQKD